MGHVLTSYLRLLFGIIILHELLRFVQASNTDIRYPTCFNAPATEPNSMADDTRCSLVSLARLRGPWLAWKWESG